MKKYHYLFILLFLTNTLIAQLPFAYDNNNTGRRVVLIQAIVSEIPARITIQLLDAAANPTESIKIFRRPLMTTGSDWQLQATLTGGTTQWVDNNVSVGQVWEYQVKRTTNNGDAIGYTTGCIKYDQSNYRGRMILLCDSSLLLPLTLEIDQLKKDLTGDGWFVEQLAVNKAIGWYSGATVVQVKQKIKTVYDAAPSNDKPQVLFLLGHIPMPRSGGNGYPPDEHDENKGARGADVYYADIDGVFTDNATYNPGNLVTPLAINLPNDYKWDQDFLPSNIEIAFGRVDFTDLTQSYPTKTDTELIRGYLNRLHSYKIVATGWNMGNKMAFNFGYDNSNDGTYRSLIPIAGKENIVQNNGTTPHPEWVKNNGPFLFYMQNVQVPELAEWNTHGMNATVYSSDQSYYGFGDVPESNLYSKIRALLATDTKNLVNLWTTTGINIFHQPGAGVPFGIACKQIMNHNSNNNILEKPSQTYDTPDWWNRTHFQYHGDPTLRFFQVVPPTNLVVGGSITNPQLKWNKSTDASVVGYHVYKANAEFGKYEKITTSIVTDSFYNLNNPIINEWYMVRAVKLQVTGSGTFYNPSQGIFTIYSAPTAIVNVSLGKQIKIFPNPAIDKIYVVAPNAIIKNIRMFNLQGQEVNCIFNANNNFITLEKASSGIYTLLIATNKGLAKKTIMIE